MTADLIDEGVGFAPNVGITSAATIAVEAVPSQVANTTIGVGSNGQTLPQGTIFAASTAGFPASGTILVTTSSGVYAVTYKTVTGGVTPSFGGCAGGAGIMTTGGAIVSGALVEIVKVLLGADGHNDGFVASTNPMPVTAVALPLPAGAATEATLEDVDVDIEAIHTTQTDGTQKTQVTNFPATQPVSGTVTANQGTSPWISNDNFSSFEALADQPGAGGVLTFTFSAAVDLIWVQSNGATSRAVIGAQTPSATLGAFCADGTPLPIPIHATTVKVFSPVGATVSVWGERY
jgi:hypothetical protein